MAVNDQLDRPNPDEALEQLGRLALREHSMQSFLQAVADLTKSVMPGDAEASVSLLVDDRPRTVVFTGRLAMDCDESQYGHGYGPCLHAARTGEFVEIADARAETRWQGYVQRAVAHGALGSLSVPLPVTDGVGGALNIYAREADAFDDDSRSVATRLAPYAAVAVQNMYAYESARDVARNYEIALESRAVIDQAKGILMERHRTTADVAFQTLAHVSMHTNTKVRDVAESLVRSGVLPKG